MNAKVIVTNIKFKTETGSVYEVQGQSIRRVSGDSPATSRHFKTDAWVPFEDISDDIQLGMRPIVQFTILNYAYISEVVAIL